jgi:hypothetical protein
MEALKEFVKTQTVLVTGVADAHEYNIAWLGLQFFRQSATLPPDGECPSCQNNAAWQDAFLSPWSKDMILKSNGSEMVDEFNEALPCYILRGSEHFESHSCYQELGSDQKHLEYPAICEYRSCSPCQFPFKLAGRLYDTCTTVGSPDRTAWCPTELDASGHHVEGKAVPCPADCPVSDCPVGFMPHLSTCIQESASILADAPTNIAEAESRCLVQGGRLFQPRSKRSLDALKVKNPAFYDSANSMVGILNWASGAFDQRTAFGVRMKNAQNSSDILYRDGSTFPGDLMPTSLSWKDGYPKADGNKSCVTILDKEKLGNVDCEGFSEGASPTFLAYICEARPFTTEKVAPNPGRSCHFPFRLEAEGEWHHSCMYERRENGNNYVWCPTSVDAEGVMIEEGVGECSDERNTAIGGPGDGVHCVKLFIIT